MKKVLIFISLICFAHSAMYSQCSTQTLGPNDYNQISFESAQFVSLTLDGNGESYIVFSDDDKSNKATVRKSNGVDWEFVGDPGFSNGKIASTSIAFDNNSILHVAYSDFGLSNGIVVKKFNGTSWVSVGTDGFDVGGFNADQPLTLRFDSNNIPYIAYENQDGKAAVKKFDGNSWQDVGTYGFSPASCEHLQFAIDNNDSLYTFFVDNSVSGKATVMKFDGNSWKVTGTKGFSSGKAYYGSITFDNSNMPIVSYQNNYNNAIVKKYDGNNWSTVGAVDFSNGGVQNTKIAVDQTGNVFVSYIDMANAEKCTVMKFDGVNWALVGQAAFSGKIRNGDNNLVINAANQPVVAFAELDNVMMNRASALKFNGSKWERLTDVGFSATITDVSDVTHYSQIKVDQNKVPYVAYTIGNVVKMKKFVANEWVAVGASIGTTEFTKQMFAMDLDDSGVPYVVYADAANNFKIIVKKFDGNSWVQVGPSGFSTYSVSYVCIDINENGIVYVGYRTQNPSRMTVKKYDGVSWETVGSQETFSPGEVKNCRIAVDDTIVYVTFRDMDNINNINSLMKYDGSSWSTLTAFGQSKSDAEAASLVLYNHIPYVAYVAGKICYVFKYTTKKESVGNNGIYPITADVFGYLSLAVSANGVPSLALTTSSPTSKGALMTLNNGIWEVVKYTADYAKYTSLAIDKDGDTYMVFSTSGGLYTYKSSCPLVTNTVETSFTGTVAAYPNPVSETLTIQAPNNSVLTVYNLVGEQLLPQIRVEGAQFNLDVSNYSDGIYFVSVINPELHKNESIKFIVKK